MKANINRPTTVRPNQFLIETKAPCTYQGSRWNLWTSSASDGDLCAGETNSNLCQGISSLSVGFGTLVLLLRL